MIVNKRHTNRSNRIMASLLVCVLVVLSAAFMMPQRRATLYIIGDSTVRNKNTNGQWGWGSLISSFFDSSKLAVSNQAMAGRSTRTFIKESRWDTVLSTIQAGDYVMMQFGHNEGARPDTSRAGYRGVLRGTGQDTSILTWPNGDRETVHTYGWYLTKFITEAKAKGAIPIVVSLIPRNIFKDDKVARGDKDFGKWAMETARDNGAFFIDLNRIVADKYDTMGSVKVSAFFPGDHTHTNKEGAALNAASVIEGLRTIKACGLNQYLLP
ncbi:MAG: rhamnogalacturonan acetylesterase [Chitinophagaceae bacterium]